MRKKFRKANKGVTLIALVVTIIVTIILAVTTIRIIVGDDGIIGKAEKADEEHKKAQLQEEIDLEVSNLIADKRERKEKVTSNDLITLMTEKGGVITSTVDEIITGEYDGYEFMITGKQIEIGARLTGDLPEANITVSEEEKEELYVELQVEVIKGDLASVEPIKKYDGLEHTGTTDKSKTYTVTKNRNL